MAKQFRIGQGFDVHRFRRGRKLILGGIELPSPTGLLGHSDADVVLHSVINALLKEGAVVAAFDPEAMNNVKGVVGDKIGYSETQYGALEGADALVIATEWSEFRTPDFNKISSLLKNKAIFDGRNLFDLKQMEQLGFHYVSIGRKVISSI